MVCQLSFLVFCSVAILVQSIAIPTDKIINHRSASSSRKKQLNEHDHYLDSDHDGIDDVHNRDYDHEAFLGGEDEADEFDSLSPEESRERLAKLVDRIDVNHDGNITEVELKNWVYQSQHKYILDDVSRQWHAHVDGQNDNQLLTWNDFKNKTYGFLEENLHEYFANKPEEELKTYKKMLRFVLR